MKILAISSTFPYPPTRGGTHNRTFNLLKYIFPNHSVTLITQSVEDIKEQEIEELKSYVEELVIFPRPSEKSTNFIDKLNNFSTFLFKGIPPNVLYLYSEEMQSWIDHAVKLQKFDAITCEHSVNQIYIRPQWQKSINTVVNIHSSLYRTCKNQLETNTSDNPKRDRLYLPLLRRYEQNYLSKFSQVVVTTDEDEEQMKNFNSKAKVTVIPNGVDLDQFPYRTADPGGYKLVFVGGLDYFVNIDGACFLSREILPRLQTKYPNVSVILVGSKPSQEVRQLAENPAITVTGRVPSVVEYLHMATVSVVPLRTGFGMKIKTLESMAAGAPVVGSDRGLEGIQVDTPQVPLRALRANNLDEYVEAISRLFDNPDLREKLARNGRDMIEEEYTWKNISAKYEKIIRK